MPTFTPTLAKTVAQTGSGEVLALSIDGGTTFTQIMGTQAISYSGQQRDSEDITSTTSIGDYKEFLMTLKDGGSVKFDLVINTADPGQIALMAAYDSGTLLVVKHFYKLLPGFTSPASNQFSCYVAEDPLPGSDAGKVSKVSVSLKITGPITKTAAVATV